MKILVVGNMGYVGSVLVPYLRNNYPKSFIAGLDIGYFSEKILPNYHPESSLDSQIIMDIRDLKKSNIQGYDVIINLAAVSNDPMGEEFEGATREINFSCRSSFSKISKTSWSQKNLYLPQVVVFMVKVTESQKQN